MKTITYSLILLLTLFFQFQNLYAQYAGDLLVYWPFDEEYPYGYVSPDASGNSNDALLQWSRIRYGGGGEIVPNEGIRGGKAIIKDRGTIVSRDSLTLPAEWTISTWFKLDANVGRYEHLMRAMAADGSTVFYLSYNQNKLKFSVNSNGENSVKNYSSPDWSAAGWLPNTWVHLCLVHRANEIEFFINGASLGSQSTLAWNTNAKFRLNVLGTRAHPHNRLQNGIDEFRIYKKALNAATVAEMANINAAFYSNEVLPPIADAGLGYTQFLQGGSATITMQGRINPTLLGQNGGANTVQWAVLNAPNGAVYNFTDNTDLQTTFTTNTIGDYQFLLTTRNDSLIDSDTVRLVVFEADDGSGHTGTYAYDPASPIRMTTFEPKRIERVPTGNLPIVAHYKLDETSGTTANASGTSGGSFDIGSSIKSQWSTDGVHGGCLKITETQQLDLGAFPELEDEFSLSFWAKSDRSDKRAPLFKILGTTDSDYFAHLRVQQNQGGLQPFYAATNWGTSEMLSERAIKLYNKWNHIVITFNKYLPNGTEEVNIRKMYINGWLVAYQKFDPFDAANGAARLTFSEAGSRGFIGSLDDVVLYSKVLNNDEVRAIYEGVSSAENYITRSSQDPYTSNGYTTNFEQTYFPYPTEEFVTTGFAASRFGGGTVASPYEHPRLLFSMDDLPNIREGVRTKDGNRIFWEMVQYADAMRFTNGTMDANGNYIPGIKFVPDDPNTTTDESNGGLAFSTDNGNAATIILEAYEALLTANSTKARQLIAWMDSCAVVQRHVLDNHPPTSDWQHFTHDLMMRRATPIVYDYLYPWMTTAERTKFRSIIADATKNAYTIGLHGYSAVNTSNWAPWLAGDLLIAVASIYQEDGFDTNVFNAARQAVLNTAQNYGDPESGATYEGMGKGNIGTQYYSMISRTQSSDLMASSKFLYNHVRKFSFHMLNPWMTSIYHDEKNGGQSLLSLPATSVRLAHYAYPNDPILDFMKRLTADIRPYGVVQFNTFGQDSDAMLAPLTQDWSTAQSFESHLQAATSAANEPLGYFSDYRGLMVSRGEWSFNTLQLIFQPRTIKGGHSIPDRGKITINAYGRTWIPFEGEDFAVSNSRFQAVVQTSTDSINFTGQSNVSASLIAYEGAQKTPGAHADILSSDLTECYQNVNNRTRNQRRLTPDTQRPWMNLPEEQLPEWYAMNKVASPNAVTYGLDDDEPATPFEYAYRTAALVRGSHPYVLVLGDYMVSDTSESWYKWSIPISKDIYDNGSGQFIAITGDTVILTNPLNISQKMMITVFDTAGRDGNWMTELEIQDNNGDGAYTSDLEGELPKLTYLVKGDSVKFRIFIYPYVDGVSPSPSITKVDSVTYDICIDGHLDKLVMKTTQGKPTQVSVTESVCSVLPVNLMDFDGWEQDCNVVLSWMVGSEENFDYYEVQRSYDGRFFQKIKQVKGTGTNTFAHYEAIDSNALDRNYYRLKIVDLDGQFEYSDIIQVKKDCASHNKIEIFPNPTSKSFSSEMTVRFYSNAEETHLFIIDQLGRMVKQIPISSSGAAWNSLEIDTSDLPKGTYMLFLEKSKMTKRFVVLD